MKIEYIKKIHKEAGKPDRFTFTIINGDHLLQYCCARSKQASESGFFEIAYNKTEREDISWKERHDENKPQDKPLICMITNEVGSCEDVERKLFPIDRCPFCGAENEIILNQVKEITHIVTKKLVPEHEETGYTTQEKIVFETNEKQKLTEVQANE